MKEMKEILVEHERLVAHLGTQLAVVQAISNSIIHAIEADNRVYLMGNGGSRRMLSISRPSCWAVFVRTARPYPPSR